MGLFDRTNEHISNLFGDGLSVWDISQKLGLDYWDVRECVEKFVAKGLVMRG